jgi:uncharacterized repeat protein (TIGR03803 family)
MKTRKREFMKTSLKNPCILPVLIAGLSLILAGRVTAQSFTTLHYFTGPTSDGDNPLAGLIISGNTLYGAADSGGSWNNGTVFALNTNGTAFTNLYSFTGGNDGQNPDGTLVLSGNTLYGTASGGGAYSQGTVFAVSTNGSAFTNLYSFAGGSDGAEPNDTLLLSGNTLYGTTRGGGSAGYGVVFKVNTNGIGFTNLYSFTNGSDGAQPHSLVISGSTLYGPTLGGTVFKVNTDGTSFTILHSFMAANYSVTNIASGSTAPAFANSDGVGAAGLILSGNTLYGTAFFGGANGNGTVFALNTDGTGFTNLHSFAASSINSAGLYANSDGAHPYERGLVLSGNTLYGTAAVGGINGNGTVFALNTNGTGFTILHSFAAGTGSFPHNYINSDGATPFDAALILSGNTLYGTAKAGGTNGNGTVFSMSLAFAVITTALPNGTNGAAYSQTLTAFGGQTPYSWTNSSGALPPGLTLAANGVISGTPTNNGIFNFTVKVTDATNSTATRPLTLTVGSPPSVVAIQPTNSSVTVPVGSNVTFVVSVAGTGPFSYQWQLNGTNLPNGIITTVAGGGNSGLGDGGAATNAELAGPSGVAVDAAGNLFIADEFNNRIRKVGTNGVISTVAGNGYGAGGPGGYSGDGGAATNAELNYPSGVAVDATGNLFIADLYNNVIRKVGTNGIITTVAGNGYGAGQGFGGYSGDGGAAISAELNAPYGVAVDATDNLFIVDEDNNCIRKVGTYGIINTVAGIGTPGYAGYSGDGRTATNAQLCGPSGVAVDATGNLFIADEVNQRIRKVGTNGIITTVAGNGKGSYSGDGGAATNADLNFPAGVAVDATGNLFIADSSNYRIRKVATSGIITTVAGGGTNGLGDGGAATNAELLFPDGVAVDAIGNLFIAGSSSIRKVVFPGPTLVLNAVGFGNAGAYDVVVSSPYGSVTSSVVHLTVGIILSAPQVTGGRSNFTCLLSGPAGSNYVLEASTNLSYWSNVSTSTMPVSGSMTLTNAISGYNRRFYRAFMQ